MDVLIIGAGVGGLTLGLMLHKAGIPCRIYEAAPEIKPLGVGINLLPHAMKELSALGLEETLAARGVLTAEAVFFNRFGQLIYREPLGRAAGYDWPQVSIHRGDLQAALVDAFIARAGADRLMLGWQCTKVEDSGGAATAYFRRMATPEVLPRRRGHRLRRHPFGAAQAALPRRGRADLFRRQHVARRDALAADPVGRGDDPRRLVHPREDRALSDPQRYRCGRPSACQLGGGDRDAQIRALELEPDGEARGFHRADGGLAFRLARRAGIPPPLRSRAGISHGRQGPAAALELRPHQPARRCGAPDVSARLERCGPGNPRCARARRLPRRRRRFHRRAERL